MGRIAIAVKHMLICGASNEAVIAAIEDMEAIEDGALAYSRAINAERQRRYRNAHNAHNVTNVSDATPMVSPIPPSLTPTAFPKSEKLMLKSDDEGFLLFWKSYPRKVGKGGARKAYRHALKRATPEEILAGAGKFATLCVGKDPEFIPHAATWLNADRWADEVATNGSSPGPGNYPKRTWAEIKAERERTQQSTSEKH